jgi:hypothetical protein
MAVGRLSRKKLRGHSGEVCSHWDDVFAMLLVASVAMLCLTLDAGKRKRWRAAAGRAQLAHSNAGMADGGPAVETTPQLEV